MDKGKLATETQKKIVASAEKAVADLLKGRMVKEDIAKVIGVVDKTVSTSLKDVTIESPEKAMAKAVETAKTGPIKIGDTVRLTRGVRRVISASLKGVPRKDVTNVKGLLEKELKKALKTVQVMRIPASKIQEFEKTKAAKVANG